MIGVIGRSNFGHTMPLKILEVMQNQLEGLSFNFLYCCCCIFIFIFFFVHCCIDVNARCFLYPASINEMPTPASVFVLIRTSYTKFYNPFRMIRVKLAYCRYSLFTIIKAIQEIKSRIKVVKEDEYSRGLVKIQV